MIKVHHLNQSRSKRVLWLLEELQMPFELVKHQRDPQTRLAPASLKAVHPLAKAPVIVDGEVTLCESGAVMEYILDQDIKTGLRPGKNSAEYYAYLEWLHFAEGSLALPVIANLFMSMEERSGKFPMDAYIQKELALDFNYIESTLNKRSFFAGDSFTAADIMMTVILEFANNSGLLVDKENTLAYLETMQKREAYIKAVAYG